MYAYLFSWPVWNLRGTRRRDLDTVQEISQVRQCRRGQRANASWTNTIGAPELIAVWEDPQFDPGQPAFYYGRVIEIPTPRWTAYDAKRYGVEPLEGTTMTLQERAYTSPIWYSPAD